MTPRDPDCERLDLLGRAIPWGFDVEVVVLGPGCELPTEERARRDVLIEVDDGEVEVELSSGQTQRFGPGSVLWLTHGRLRALPEAPAVVIVMGRSAGTRPGAALSPVRDEDSGESRLNTHDDNRADHDHRPRI